jgi:hypothetical protein
MYHRVSWKREVCCSKGIITGKRISHKQHIPVTTKQERTFFSDTNLWPKQPIAKVPSVVAPEGRNQANVATTSNRPMYNRSP